MALKRSGEGNPSGSRNIFKCSKRTARSVPALNAKAEQEPESIAEGTLERDACGEREAEPQAFIQEVRDAAGGARTSNDTIEPAACADRRKLEREVVAAVEAVYRGGGDNREEVGLIESQAVSALEAHIDEHGCGDQGLVIRGTDAD